MATKKTWDDVLRERGFDPEQRKRKQAAKQTLDLPSNRYTLLESQIRQVSGIEQAQKAAAESDAIKALDRLKTLTLGGFAKPSWKGRLWSGRRRGETGTCRH